MSKPSAIKLIKAKKTSLLLPNFKAITLFGTIYCKNEKDVESINATDEIDSTLKCHETIHIRQAEGTKDSWFVFYLKYIWQWIKNLPMIFIDVNAPYKFIPLELEAYEHERDFAYPTNGGVRDWEKYAKLSLKQKKGFAKQYYNAKPKMTFNKFINTVMLPLLG